MSGRLDAGFERLDRDIRELRVELKQELREMRTTMSRAAAGIVVGLVVAVLSNGI